jgi:hypothetical protein
MFQHTVIAKDETRKLLNTINNAQSDPIAKDILDKSFDALWPDLEKKLGGIPHAEVESEPDLEDMVAEVLELVRGLPTEIVAEISVAEGERAIQRAELRRGKHVLINAAQAFKYGASLSERPDSTPPTGGSNALEALLRAQHRKD